MLCGGGFHGQRRFQEQRLCHGRHGHRSHGGMPRYVMHRPRFQRPGARPTTTGSRPSMPVHPFEYWMSVGYHCGSACFVVGSYFFCTSLGSRSLLDDEMRTQSAEAFMTAGCTVFMGLTFMDVLEATQANAPSGEIVEKHLYFWGSVIFEVGTVLHTPRMTQVLFNPLQLDVAANAGTGCGTALFILGSLVFNLASFVNALDFTADGPGTSRWVLATCAVYQFGGMLFVMGSMAYLGPDVSNCASWLLEMGNVCYLLGSLAYLSGDALGLRALVELSRSTYAELVPGEQELWKIGTTEIEDDDDSESE